MYSSLGLLPDFIPVLQFPFSSSQSANPSPGTVPQCPDREALLPADRSANHTAWPLAWPSSVFPFRPEGTTPHRLIPCSYVLRFAYRVPSSSALQTTPLCCPSGLPSHTITTLFLLSFQWDVISSFLTPLCFHCSH